MGQHFLETQYNGRNLFLEEKEEEGIARDRWIDREIESSFRNMAEA